MTVKQFRRFLSEHGLEADWIGDANVVYGKTYYIRGLHTGKTAGTFHVDFTGAAAWVYVRLY